MDEIKNILKDLVSAHGVSGDEKSARKVAKKYLDKFGKTSVDNIGNLICEIIPFKEGKENILLDAHIDEIGFVVTGFTEDGFIKVAEIGGLDNKVLTASEVYILSKKETYYGIITSTPPHLTKKEDYKKATPISDLSIDVGMDKKTAEKKISLGDRVVVKGDFRETINGRIISKSLDDRLGCATLIRVAQMLKGEKLDVGLSIMFSVQEEVGVRGARVGAYYINPTHAIAVDGTFGDSEIYPKESFKLGGGPVIAVGPILNNEMTEEIMNLAKNNNITYSTEVTTRNTGTNADSISLVRSGVKTAMISLPVKNIHSKIEMAEIKDLEDTAKLISLYIKERSR